MGLLPHRGTSASWHKVVNTTEEGIPVRLRAGEAVAFSGYTLHRSKQNLTSRPRPSFFMQYADAQASFAQGGSPVMSDHNAFLVSGQLPYPLPEEVVVK
jgi:ectoine hydroxylase-related dioxygenase (phytanoyl-CoA dioxygenase family)